MQNLEKAAQELQRQGKTEQIRALAESADGRKLGQMLDAGAVEKAVKGGDSAALQQILRGVLGTPEGKRLAEQLRKAMQK